MTRKVLLSKGAFALVDSEDYEYLTQWRWHLHIGGYAVRKDGRVSNRDKTIYMHKEINKTPDGMVTDHINRNRLDNRRENLRTVSYSGNGLNKTCKYLSQSGYRHVYFVKKRANNPKPYEAKIKRGGITKTLGYFESAIKAHNFMKGTLV